jgi:myosin-crossreactive antigen
MKNYDRINALPPKDIERKRAHIVGGGIAGFATAAFLIDDALGDVNPRRCGCNAPAWCDEGETMT